jgi:hypothetical protein
MLGFDYSWLPWWFWIFPESYCISFLQRGQRFACVVEIFLLLLLLFSTNGEGCGTVNGCWLKSLMGNGKTGSESSAHKCLGWCYSIYKSIPIVQQCQIRVTTFLKYVLYCLYGPLVKTSRLGILRANCSMYEVILTGKALVLCWGVLRPIVWNYSFWNPVSAEKWFSFLDNGARFSISEFGYFWVTAVVIDNY